MRRCRNCSGIFSPSWQAAAEEERQVEEIGSIRLVVGSCRIKLKSLKMLWADDRQEEGYGGRKVPDKLDGVHWGSCRESKKTHALFLWPWCLWDSRGDSGHTRFRISWDWAGQEGKNPPTGGAGADEGASKGTLEPDQFSAYLAGQAIWQPCSLKAQCPGLPAAGMIGIRCEIALYVFWGHRS